MKKLGLLVMPLMVISFLTSCGKTERFVSFESHGGSHIDTQRIKGGATATRPTPNPTRDNDEFKGWFTDDGTFQNEYKFTEPVKNDITLYAKWHEVEGKTFTITFKNEGDEDKKIENIESGSIVTDIPAPSLRKDYSFIGWCTDPDSKKIFDFSKIQIFQDYTLYAGWEKDDPEPYYFDVTTNGENIKYWYDEEMTIPLDTFKIYKLDMKDLVFYMQAINEENAEGYVPPTALDIKSNQVPIEYSIEAIEESPTVKKVTIGKENIKGNVSIKGDAIKTNYYQITMPYFFGLKPIAYAYTFSEYNTDAVINFEPMEGLKYNGELLKAENIYVSLTGEDDDWISPNDKEAQDKIEFKHENNEYTLTIKAGVVSTSTNVIKLVARAKDYHQILDEFSWDAIEEISKDTDLKNRLFSLGDTKTVDIAGRYYKARIISFSQDKTLEGKNVITFDFADSLSARTYWDTNKKTNYDFIHSNVNNNLQKGGFVYNAIPNVLMKHIKDVSKEVEIFNESESIYEVKPYTTKLFSLSVYEIKKEREKCYDYYKENGAVLKKGEPYWLRSPNTNPERSAFAWYVDEDGKVKNNAPVDETAASYSVTPAFCI